MTAYNSTSSMDINKYNNSENVFHFMGKYYGEYRGK